MDPNRRSGWTVRKMIVSLALAGPAIGAGVLAVRGQFADSTSDESKYVTDVAKRAPFVISVTERGELDSLRNATLSCAVEGQTTIIWIVPEGTPVAKGELVVELDSSYLEEQEKQGRILVTQAEADLRKATENVEIQKRQNESDVAAAKLAQELAALDFEKYSAENGEFYQLQNEIKGEMAVSEEELTRALETYEFSKRLAKKGYKSQNDLEADRIGVNRARIKRDVAADKLNVLQAFTYKRTIRELEEKAAESARQLDRVKRQGRAALAQFEADLQARRLTFEVEEAKMQKLQAQIAACKIHATQEGRVVYANQNNRRGGNDATIEEGATVRERQAIINIPDLKNMKVDVRIHESKISRLRDGLPATIQVVAFGDAVYRGVVESVSAVPVSGNWRRPNNKEYETVVRIVEEDEARMMRLKPGLTASVEILVDRRENVLQVPIQSVVSVGDQQMAYVLGSKGPERRDLVIGDSNDTAIEILDGVGEGERVVMNPRTHFGEEINAISTKAAKEREEKANAGAPAETEVPAASPGDAEGKPATETPKGYPSETTPRVAAPDAAASKDVAPVASELPAGGKATRPDPRQTAERPDGPRVSPPPGRSGAE